MELKQPLENAKDTLHQRPELRLVISQEVQRPKVAEPPPCCQPVFTVDDTFFRSRTPSTTHWSVGWADLMMTMFVLFLTLFVYQLAHRQFLSEESPEVVAGVSMAVSPASSSLPFTPIAPIISQEPTDVLKKLEPVSTRSSTDQSRVTNNVTTPPVAPESKVPTIAAISEPDTMQEGPVAPLSATSVIPFPADTLSSPPLDLEKKKEPQSRSMATPTHGSQPILTETTPRTEPDVPARQELIAEIYDLSRIQIAKEKLEKFSQVELIPEKAIRIILTGDLLFPLGQATLTAKAKRDLRKLLPIIAKTPYMINVEGHTDNVPMHSSRFASNWELSTARASQVARYLIEAGHIDPRQIVVSGYSYFRPRQPNDTAAHRRANRRVEIILSRQPAPAVQPEPARVSALASSLPKTIASAITNKD